MISARKPDWGKPGKWFIRANRATHRHRIGCWFVYGPTDDQPRARFSEYDAARGFFIQETRGIK